MSGTLRDQLQTTLSGTHTIERELGGGGMSKVFVAEETRLKRKVVVKVLSPELAQGISVERFEREIQVAAALQQANIVPVLSAGDTNGLPFYTMPFVEGESLRARLGKGPLAISEVVSVLRDVARALAYAHSRGVVHRDIKPDNVLLSGGAAVVTDFGIAKAITAARTGSGGATLTQVGVSIGTPAYMAPEQAAGDADIDHRADIYALGAMAYELLSGQAVFAGRTPQRMLAAHMSEAPKNISELRADTPAALGELIMRCLAKDQAHRPQSGGEVAQALETTSGSGMTAMPAILLGGSGMFKKALAIYAAAFVVVAILARAAIVGIGLPEWVFAGSLIVMALGLPVVLWTGYVQRVARRAALASPTFTPGGTATTTQHGTIATMALKAAPKASWYRTARGGIYAMGTFIAAIAIAMAMRAFDIGPFATLRGSLGNGASLVLSDFRVSNADSTLGRVVSDAVRAGLSGSRAFTLTPPAAVAAALGRMKRPLTTRLDSAVVREIAQREGIKAYIDGEVAGVAGGYVISLRLVRADSGIEMASFRESGDGPRGVIDASDMLARALRSKAGESLRRVNATPPLAQVTSASLDALRKLSESMRLNSAGLMCPQAIAPAREAVAIDSTFATAWSGLAAVLSNCRFPQSSIDSATTQAYRFREKLPATERDMITGRYFALGAGRDRNRSLDAYEAVLKRGDTSAAVLISLGEILRSKREFAKSEALNLEAFRLSPTSAVALGNAVEMEMNQGKYKEAAANLERLRMISMPYYAGRRSMLNAIQGEYAAQKAWSDTVEALPPAMNVGPQPVARRTAALREGRLRDLDRLFGSPKLSDNPGYAQGRIERELVAKGRSRAISAGLDSLQAAVPFAEIPLVDRPYLRLANSFAQAGHPDKARALVARYRADVTDTAFRRMNDWQVHNTLGEIALAEGKYQEAREEFQRGDVGFDGAPSSECSFCLAYNLARVHDAAGAADSAIANYERYLATPHWFKAQLTGDPPKLASIHERLGQLHEAKGDAAKAAAHYHAFIELWKNADPELQPRVAAAKKRLAELNPVEGKKP
jgi:tetratricopeptide (TPR) repeat protein